MQHQEHDKPYTRLIVMTVLSFFSMYLLMYAMVDRLANVYSSLNEVYMAGLMTAPMLVLEFAVMGAMYGNKKLNAILFTAGLAAGIGFFVLIRQQVGIADEQFLRSMIPHHAGAILMCQEASIQEPEIKRLCQTIVASQQAEIDQMKLLLKKHN